MATLIKILQLILALSLLVFIHELGHFCWARIFGIRVDKFYLFFDVGGKALFRFKRGDTEFGVGWLPLGGYCKISGMVDESMDTDSLKSDPKPWEFRTHPAWQRFLVLAGGVLNNFIFAILAYICIMSIWGDAYVSNTGARIYVSDLAYDMGFRSGDHIISLDDYEPEDFYMMQADIARKDVRYANILRGEDTLQLYIDRARIGELLNTPRLFDLAVPFVVDSVSVAGPNVGAGLQNGDKVIGIDGESISYLQEAVPVLASHKGENVMADVVRGADTLEVAIQVDSSGLMGVFIHPGADLCVRHYSFFEAVPAGFRLAISTVGSYIQDMKLVAEPSTGAYKSVGSFISMGQIFPSAWDWYRFLNIVALLSIMLAVMNLLPIPGLDGGHMVFTIYEMVTGRKPSERFLIAAQMVGMALLFALMMLAFGNDIGRLIH